MDNETSAQEMERNEKPLNELLTTAMVNIYVGPENTHWYIHERLLCYYSPFFSEIFYADDKNEEKSKAQRNKAYGLPDEEDLAFEMLVGWLYSRDIKVPREEKDLSPLLDLYLLSEKLQMERLSHELVEAVSHFYFQTHSYPSLRRVQYVYTNTEEDNEMREMMVGSIAKLLTTSDKIPAHWASALQRNGQLAVDIIRSIQQWKIEEKTIPDARDRSASRGRSDKNGFSAVERSGTDSMETTGKTDGTSNMGVESVNSDHDQDQSMQDSSMMKSEDSEATSPPPTYSTVNTPETSSSQFTTPKLESGALENDSNGTPVKPKKPPDAPGKSSLSPIMGWGKGKRSLSVSFAEKVSYSTYTFFPSPSFTAHSIDDMPLEMCATSKEGLALQPLTPLPQNAENEIEKPIEGKVLNPLPAQPQRTKSDDEVICAVHRPQSSPRSRPRALAMAASRPETVMLGFLWMLYLSWLASAGL